MSEAMMQWANFSDFRFFFAAGSDFRIDTMLQEACQPVVDTACRDIRPGDARIITCLLERMDTEKMIPECEERLLEIQYFITRDWKMDPR